MVALLKFPWLSGDPVGPPPGARSPAVVARRGVRRDQGGRRLTARGGEGARGRPREVVAEIRVYALPQGTHPAVPGWAVWGLFSARCSARCSARRQSRRDEEQEPDRQVRQRGPPPRAYRLGADRDGPAGG